MLRCLHDHGNDLSCRQNPWSQQVEDDALEGVDLKLIVTTNYWGIHQRGDGREHGFIRPYHRVDLRTQTVDHATEADYAKVCFHKITQDGFLVIDH